MTRYLFHLHEYGDVTEDEEGRELPDLETARGHAETAARAIICSEVEEGNLCLGCYIEIEDRDTGSRHVVAFRDVVRITGM
jgi:hypothetical protein